jgi:hypothetical protein
VVPSSYALPRDVAAFDEVSDDSLRCTFRDADDEGEVT